MKYKIQGSYSLQQFSLWGSYGLLFSYANRYLLAQGMSNTEAGLLLGIVTAMAFVLQTSEMHKGEFPYWTLFAAHGLMRPLVSLVSPRFAGQMRVWYDEKLLRRDRLPVHKELYKLLKKRERA